MQRFKITNRQRTPLTLLIEPWGEDYTLLPDETFDVVAEHFSEDFYFHWVTNDDFTQVYAEGDREATVGVYQGERLLECGHNRSGDSQAGVDRHVTD